MSDFSDCPGITPEEIAKYAKYEAEFPKPETKLADITKARQLAIDYGCYCLWKLPAEGGDEVDCLAVRQSFITTVMPFYEWVMVDASRFGGDCVGVRLTFGNGGFWDDEERLELQFTTGEAPW